MPISDKNTHFLQGKAHDIAKHQLKRNVKYIEAGKGFHFIRKEGRCFHS